MSFGEYSINSTSGKCRMLFYKINVAYKLICFMIRKWFEPRSNIPRLKKIIWVIGVLRRTVVSD